MANFEKYEIDLFWEILNFRIISIDNIYKNYEIFNKFKDKKQKIDYLVNKFNKFLRERDIYDPILKSKKYLYVINKYDFGKLYEKEKFIYSYSIRREMIILILLLDKNKFNILKFVEKIGKEENSRKHIKNDLKKILSDINIEYEEYMNSEEPYKLIKSNINNFSKFKNNKIKETLLKRLDKYYEKRTSEVENSIIKLIFEKSEIKNIEYFYKVYNIFLDELYKEGYFLTTDEKFEILTFLILNIKNNEINKPGRVKKENLILKDDNKYKLLDKMFYNISKEENIKVYTSFKMKTFKMLLKVLEMKNSISDEISKKLNFNDYSKNKNTILNVAESIKDYNLEDFNQISEKKFKTLLVLDIEKSNIGQYIENYNLIFGMFDVVKIYNMEEVKKEVKNNEIKKDYDFILIVSYSKIQNMIENNSEIPICFIELDKGKGKKIKNRKEFLRTVLEYGSILGEFQCELEKIKKIKKF